MDDNCKLLRYLFIGNNSPYVACKRREISFEKGEAILAELIESSRTNPIEFIKLFDLIKRAIKDKSLCRNDESIFTIAFFLRKIENAKIRNEIYKNFKDFLPQCKDLFMFLDFYTRLSEKKKICCGKGLRAALTKWYDKFSAIELAEMFSKSHGMYNWKHQDILRLIHIKLEKDEKQSIVNAMYKSCTKHLAEQDEIDRRNPLETYNNEGLTRYNNICRFKRLTDEKKIADLIKLHKYSYDLVPNAFYRSAVVWEPLLILMNYKELLDVIFILMDNMLLREGGNNHFPKKYAHAIGDMRRVEQSKLHPLYIFNKYLLFKRNERYFQKIKEGYHTAKPRSPKNIPQFEQIATKLFTGFEHSFNNYPGTGTRYFITLDLKSSYTKKQVFSNRLLTCFNASLILALSLLKAERKKADNKKPENKRFENVSIYTFSDDKENLKKLELNADMSFTDASTYCTELLLPKTCANLNLPIQTAIKDKTKVDVFITIVDSVIRTNPNLKPPTDSMGDYRKAMNLKMSKYIVINLTRHQQDFVYDRENVKGIMEMSGCGPDIPKLIEAFAKQVFT
uniref:TROVE domain-containing protein n=1 Tax=Corethrella appendiculata TaxID=1370023 RepID=U5EY46_9DIPT